MSELIFEIITEAHGAIDNDVIKLADYIIDRALLKPQETLYVVPMSVIKKYCHKYNDGNLPPLTMEFSDEIPSTIDNAVAGGNYNLKDKRITIPRITKDTDLKRLQSTIAHELTHFIRDALKPQGESGNINQRYDHDKETEWLINVTHYLFQETELSARVSEFMSFLKNNPEISTIWGRETFDNERVEKIVNLKTMQRCIDRMKDDNAFLYHVFGQGVSHYLKLGQYYYKNHKKEGIDFNKKWENLNNLSPHDFIAMKKSCINHYTKILNRYKYKLHKILYDDIREKRGYDKPYL